MIESDRLELTPATPFLLMAEARSRPRLGRILDAEVPGSWPPPSVAAERKRFLRLLMDHRDDPDWADWFIILKEDSGRRVLVGSCGFHGPPTMEGRVELGYAILPPWQSAGVASESARLIIEWAFSDHRVREIRARTALGNQASIAILTKIGFVRNPADPFHPGICRFSMENPGIPS